MNKKLYLSKRPGGLGALMDLYEQEAALLFETIKNKVSEADWALIKDATTKDEDCRSIETICKHLVEAGNYYIALAKKGENPEYTIERTSVSLTGKKDFEEQFIQTLVEQANYYKNRWDLSYEEVNKIKVKTGWGDVLALDGLLEHAVMHVMRHHRQILKWLQ